MVILFLHVYQLTEDHIEWTLPTVFALILWCILFFRNALFVFSEFVCFDFYLLLFF